ncbi:MAG: 2-oxo acid dehydrogenase subunit E2 [Coleofasciculaceae cyanobacterium SM2_1_6]|nr:2-oxo acid dehydrogenase subunit E2 [Coleofasciculaceae cyanobacterium SM2_1_6]
MIHEVFMPALSSTMTEGKIVSWVKSPGDKVEKGETVVVVESDKADMDVESFYAGYLANIIVPAGESAPVGTAIALVAETEAEIAQAQTKTQSKSPTPPKASPASPPAPAKAAEPVAAKAAPPADSPSKRNGRSVISPRARKLAKDNKVDLSNVRGSGPYGRIIAEDVEVLIGKASSPVAAPVSTPAATPVTTPAVTPVSTPTPATAVTPGQVIPLTTLQNAVTRNMLASLTIPSYRVGYTITTDGLDKLAKQLKSKGVTMTALLAKAVAMTLQKHPLINAHFTEGGINYPAGINIAVAVSMPGGGLITPVLANADQVDIYSLSRTWKDLVERARNKQLQPHEYTTGTFSISNLGMFGVDRFDAILTPGQGAIMAVGASRPQVVATADGMLGVKQQMQVNLTCDHRVIYGADAAGFLKDLAQLIELNPQSLTM